MVDVYITGCRGVPMGYGGYESFVDKLVSYQQNEEVQYWIACLKDKKYEQVKYKHAFCLPMDVPAIGAATMPLFDVMALKMFIDRIKKRPNQKAVVYILACRVGPLMHHYVKSLHRLGVRVFLNPDGHEWKRGKWPLPVKMYWKLSERLMVKYADICVCDSRNIELYIQNDYSKYHPQTVFIPYGASLSPSNCDNAIYEEWCRSRGIVKDDYYLVIGRFVPENNYQTIIREFMSSETKRQLVILTNATENKFMKALLLNTKFDRDSRIVFAGTVYNSKLVKRIREGAVAYIHGHEVGGTNPSLLEALASTKVNLLYDVCFNREVGEDAALYFSKYVGSLRQVLNKVESMTEEEREIMARKAQQRIADEYLCEGISKKYEELFMCETTNIK